MSRLDSFIRRMTAQRDILNHICDTVKELEGPVLELGLGNGRTYDHLRERFPEQVIPVYRDAQDGRFEVFELRGDFAPLGK